MATRQMVLNHTVGIHAELHATLETDTVFIGVDGEDDGQIVIVRRSGGQTRIESYSLEPDLLVEIDVKLLPLAREREKLLDRMDRRRSVHERDCALDIAYALAGEGRPVEREVDVSDIEEQIEQIDAQIEHVLDMLPIDYEECLRLEHFMHDRRAEADAAEFDEEEFISTLMRGFEDLNLRNPVLVEVVTADDFVPMSRDELHEDIASLVRMQMHETSEALRGYLMDRLPGSDAWEEIRPNHPNLSPEEYVEHQIQGFQASWMDAVGRLMNLEDLGKNLFLESLSHSFAPFGVDSDGEVSRDAAVFM